MDWRIHESGKNVSGGQKQRICLARALAKASDVIVLDEATTSLDRGLEREIVKELDRYLTKHHKLLLTISHRPEIITICNKIIHLDKQVIEERLPVDEA
ncbi:ATP-binding cassette, subfamily C/ATP-binding cassette, subfamily B, MsbA/ATP-binding cassette, subfamily B, salmochelin/enterobactin exporter [Evansella caseinilytica]|uniref:ATP-binding cassette, subfamily C/ATP-binding cassette, subfamily B, MsbA/ATP-binding cassette, subfamily B, salmochelin/enterobactin exporter n=1 Tax=Evansella caseinilytica TaxID=1503961 RepID=A0A1H3U999_9BACI|nr:ATP-binding cassette, subfamily C/ATP-binding cassette, subfamily B, MsbA/ATP-binding cassette, subfamily B, salmochelin/enterobactin exporter [Evansella caseinilytica]